MEAALKENEEFLMHRKVGLKREAAAQKKLDQQNFKPGKKTDDEKFANSIPCPGSAGHAARAFREGKK